MVTDSASIESTDTLTICSNYDFSICDTIVIYDASIAIIDGIIIIIIITIITIITELEMDIIPSYIKY